jgi:hypothetical protein
VDDEPLEQSPPPPSRDEVLASRRPAPPETAASRPPPAPPAVAARPAPAAKPRTVKPAPRPAEPQLLVTRTIWHPRADRRLAMVVMPGDSTARELREGDDVGALYVKRIEPSGVVFSGEGREIVRRIGEGP